MHRPLFFFNSKFSEAEDAVGSDFCYSPPFPTSGREFRQFLAGIGHVSNLKIEPIRQQFASHNGFIAVASFVKRSCSFSRLH